MNLSEISSVVMDMDGVLWRGNNPLPGLVPFFEMLRERQLPFVLATNNSRTSPSNYVKKLESKGVPGVKEEQIVTSGTATAGYLRTVYPEGTRIHIVGEDGLCEVLEKAGFSLALHDVQIVVAGIDFEITYDKLRRATLLIRDGAEFIGTNPDVTFPSPEGLVPGTGSILAALQAATDVKPTIIGKPNLPMFETALHQLETSPDSTLMIGDRLGTDILGAQRAGMKTALVLTGVTGRAELAESDVQPDGVYEGLSELVAEWENA